MKRGRHMDEEEWGLWGPDVLTSPDELFNPPHRQRLDSCCTEDGNWLAPSTALFPDYTSDLVAQFDHPDALCLGLQTYSPEFSDLICTLGGISDLAKKHPLPCDGLVVMEEKGHRYYWRLKHTDPFRSGGTVSVSKVVDSVKAEFPAMLRSESSSKSNLRNADEEYPGTSDKYGRGVLDGDELKALERQFGLFCPERLRASWAHNGNEASRLGTLLHADIERYYEHGTLPAAPTPQFMQFLDFCKQPQYARDMVYRTELSMFCPTMGLTGQADVLFKSAKTPGKYILGDWKRLKDPHKRQDVTKEFKLAFPKADCTSVGLYHLQLNLYRFLAEQHGLDIESMFLCVFPADGSKWELYPVPRMEAETTWLLGCISSAWKGKYKL